MPPRTLAYYIYYRILPGSDAPAEAAVMLAQKEIAERSGVRGRLLRKRGEPDLWMEVYESVADAERFECALAEAIETHKLASLVRPDTVRMTECFIVS